MRLIVGTWEGDVISLSANFLNAVARLVEVYGDKLDDQQFKEKVGALSAKHISRTAKERQAGSMGYAEAMVLQYNGRRKNSAFMLPIKWLYSKRDSSSIFDVLDEPDGDDSGDGMDSNGEEDGSPDDGDWDED